MPLDPGSRVGRYEVRSLLGVGGMGEVYLAWDHDLEREVAVKVLGEVSDDSSDRVRRFLQEARTASAISHPNVATVYEIGSSGDSRFIAMELVPGEPLRARLERGPMSTNETVDLATQIAAGLAAAHEIGVVHRDIKPENVMVRPDGLAKVLDFGIAKLYQVPKEGATALQTATGMTMGTLSYMAPEQLSGGDITPAADVFSLGVVLYEMISGHRPFEGSTPTAVASGILTGSPKPLDAPPKLSAIVMKALEKAAADRYPTAAEMLSDLRHITGSPVYAASPEGPRSRVPWIIATVFIVLAITVFAVWYKMRSDRIEHARESIATAERLLRNHDYCEAYETASAALEVVPDEQRLRDVIAESSARVELRSDPPGASVFLERFDPPSERIPAGTTPLTIENLPHADYIITFEKPGYAPASRPLARYPVRFRGETLPIRPAEVSVTLFDSARVPEDMVVVSGGSYTLSGWERMSDRTVELRDFLIDRYEVSNRDFEAFVRDGAYRRPELWKTLPFDEVGTQLLDTTGLPGPRDWAGGAPPAGRENHPVTGVTWHEASAYALWKGKQLPSIYQWEKASIYQMPSPAGNSFPWGPIGEGVDATQRMNFNGRGTLPVDSMPFGLGPYGSLHMAGNVAEWTRNPLPPGYAVRGGSWNDALYTFGRTAALPAMYASAEVGFRCVKPLDGDGSGQGEFALSPSGFVPEYHPVDDATFAEIRARYDYEKSPLESRIVETIDQGDWIREKIEYDVDGRTVPAYLYLPKNYKRPLQVVHFSPAGDVYSGWRSLPHSIELSLAPLVRGGRAVFAVVMEGFIGRPYPPGGGRPDSRSAEFADFTERLVKEMRRGVDYLESREDIDHTRIAFYAQSAGAGSGLLLAAVESRYRSNLFIGTGIGSKTVTDTPAANRINFAPHVEGPTLMFQGRYDESAPLESEARPLFRLLPEPKRLEVFEGAHVPPLNIQIPLIVSWLDETMGKVE